MMAEGHYCRGRLDDRGVGTIAVPALWVYHFPELRRFRLAESSSFP